jgi:hypothetical protein
MFKVLFLADMIAGVGRPEEGEWEYLLFLPEHGVVWRV